MTAQGLQLVVCSSHTHYSSLYSDMIQEATLLFSPPFKVGSTLKGKNFCSSLSKFLSLREDTISESYLKQEFMQVNKTLYFEKKAGGIYQSRVVY